MTFRNIKVSRHFVQNRKESRDGPPQGKNTHRNQALQAKTSNDDPFISPQGNSWIGGTKRHTNVSKGVVDPEAIPLKDVCQ